MSLKSQQLIECVLNLSEGRDLTKIQEISSLIEVTGGARLLHRDIGWDAHRTVFTILGNVEEVLDAVERVVAYSLKNFDIRKHSGIHPCVGILDVIPFVALQGISPKELRAIVNRFCKYISATYDIPIIAYGELSSNASLMTLAHIRKGGIIKLKKRLLEKEILIDYGLDQAHPSQGVSCVTVRPIMIAFNINIDTQDISKARLIARELRALRKTDTRITDVRFLAWNMEEYKHCQISTNLYDIHAINMLELMILVGEVAKKYNVELKGSEMIGMVPTYGLSHHEYSVEESIKLLGLDSFEIFNRKSRLLDEALGFELL